MVTIVYDPIFGARIVVHDGPFSIIPAPTASVRTPTPPPPRRRR